MQKIAYALLTKGYYVWDGFLTSVQVEALKGCLPRSWEKAHIGHFDERVLDSKVRNDNIYWLSNELGEPVQRFLVRMKQVKKVINQHFYLGLDDYEAHFAKYHSGCFYKKHLDCFQNQNHRRISTILYLNDNWHECDGGELVIYDQKDHEIERILPKSGRLLLFFSEIYPHEVLTCHRTRLSIAGWFYTKRILKT